MTVGAEREQGMGAHCSVVLNDSAGGGAEGGESTGQLFHGSCGEDGPLVETGRQKKAPPHFMKR